MMKHVKDEWVKRIVAMCDEYYKQTGAYPSVKTWFDEDTNTLHAKTVAPWTLQK